MTSKFPRTVTMPYFKLTMYQNLEVITRALSFDQTLVLSSEILSIQRRILLQIVKALKHFKYKGHKDHFKLITIIIAFCPVLERSLRSTREYCGFPTKTKPIKNAALLQMASLSYSGDW